MTKSLDFRKPLSDDIQAAQRGLNMVAMSPEQLQRLVREFSGSSLFASQVIVLGAQQMLIAKRRAGAR